ncbi:hypothetical protein L6452_00573 [Arctium lappa]|uniref:Uncharacterized protein n=1 Tax=Arctium lappa TaxID=4217 RepID=A0ACB9FEA2_ARCLA|nr:hypothetical protein L6452_00573 [Arctium lappa]
MAKQKIVVKVAMHSEKKARKALQIVVSVCGHTDLVSVGVEKEKKTDKEKEDYEFYPYQYYYGCYGAPAPYYAYT